MQVIIAQWPFNANKVKNSSRDKDLGVDIELDVWLAWTEIQHKHCYHLWIVLKLKILFEDTEKDGFRYMPLSRRLIPLDAIIKRQEERESMTDRYVEPAK